MHYLFSNGLKARIEECLKRDLKIGTRLSADEIGVYKPIVGVPGLTFGNEKQVIYRLARLICNPAEKSQSENQMIQQIASLHDEDAGKTPYHVTMENEKLYIHQNFRQHLSEAFGNPNSGGRLDWPEFKTDRAFAMNAVNALANFSFDEGRDDPKNTHLVPGNANTDFPTRKTSPLINAKIDCLSNTNRPKVIYFGGMIRMSEEPNYVARAFNRLSRTIEPANIPTSEYDAYVVTYTNRASYRKTEYSLRYEEDPQNFFSPNAQKVVTQFLMPLIADKHDTEWKRLDAKELKRRLSLVTFCGYSYGTCFIQEVRNAMHVTLKGLGYSGEEIKSALSCVAAVNLGSSCSVYDKTHEGDFIQLFTAAEGDATTDTKTNIPALTHTDPNPHVKKHAISHDDKVQTLILRGMNVPGDLPSFSTKKISKLEGIKNVDGIYVADHEVSQDNRSRHHIESFLRRNRVREDDKRLTVAITPVSIIARRFLQNQMNGALDVANQKKTERPSASILNELHDEIADRKIFDYVNESAHILHALREELKRRPLSNSPHL